MTKLDLDSDTETNQALNYLRQKGILTSEEKVSCSDFNTILPKLNVEGTIVILRITFKAQPQIARRVLKDNTTVTGDPGDLTTNVIYVKPDAVFGIGLSIFIFFIAYIGVMCLYGVNTPKGFASKPFKFGREL